MTVRCPSNGRSASSTSGLLAPAAQSSPVVPHAPASRGRLCCRGGLTAPYYSHRWLGPTATAASHRSRTSEPSYSFPRGLPLPRLPRLRVVPFLGLASSTAVVLSARRGQCGQQPTSIGRVLYVERLTAGSMATAQVFCDLPSKSLCQACWAANLSRRGELSFGWPRKWPISNEKWAVHF